MEEPTAAESFRSFEVAGWEARAEEYHHFFASVTTRVVGCLLDAAGVASGSRVLDVATGPGYVAGACAARGAQVLGVDVAQEMVRLARRLHPGLEFRAADAERLPFADATFDAVVGNFAVLHLARPERVVAELVRVLAPGGALALSTWDTPDRCRLLGLFVDAVAEVGAPPPADLPEGPPFFRFSDDREFAALLAAAGLVGVGVQTLGFTVRLPGAEALWDGLLAGTVRTRALVLGQPEPTRRRIRAAFDRLAGRYLVDGGLDAPVSVKVASGRRHGSAPDPGAPDGGR